VTTQMAPADVAARFQVLAGPWMTGDFTGVDDLMAPDVRYHMPPFPDLDRDGYRHFIEGFRTAFTEFSVTVDQTIVEGNRSAHLWHCEAVLSGESPVLPGVHATGRRTAATGTHVCIWEDGRVVEAWHHGDWLTWLTMAGVLPPMGG
jgi:predicted ester cyclase